MINPGEISIHDFDYPLDRGRIAQYPLPERDISKLLVYKNGSIQDDLFLNVANHLPSGSLVVFNQTRVIQARLLFARETGSLIEIFCLEPHWTAPDMQTAFMETGETTWKCLVGNARRWKSGPLILSVGKDGNTATLQAEMKEREGDHFIIKFRWAPAEMSFSSVLETFGKTPLPPYITRKGGEADRVRYQTLFACDEGSIAAPTAGLHFTDKVIGRLEERGIRKATVTLHVGAGTFKPVVSDTIGRHEMHAEQVIIPVSAMKSILSQPGQFITLVGTTTVRAIESAYWQGVKWLRHEPSVAELRVDQWDPYMTENPEGIPLADAIGKVVQTLEKHDLEYLKGYTRLMIVPGYEYRVPDAIITNFHMPRSTLLLLVAAFIGRDWKKAYTFALDNGYRFLSYGDSCLFFRNDDTIK